jgi:phosphoribosylaminoimidazole carboxylase (NCAIR synthetase)
LKHFSRLFTSVVDLERTLGFYGGEQLGCMLIEAANRLNIKVVTLDIERVPAKERNATAGHVNGSFTYPQAIHKTARRCDVLTVGIEHVDTNVLEDLAEGTETREDYVYYIPSSNLLIQKTILVVSASSV